jgi:glutaredoxin/glutathione-dependent peroxiredoxin
MVSRDNRKQGKTRIMTISVGDKLPEVAVMTLGADGPAPVELGEKLFAVAGAYTPTCHSAHVPSFVRQKEALAAKGVDEIICLSVNDPWVMNAWGEATGAAGEGITMLADSSGAFTKAIGMDFDAPPVGFVSRSKRYALMAEDGVVKVLHAEESPGTCEISGGEAMVAAL